MKHDFCTCTFLDCPRHPRNQESGCSLCVAENLKRGEIPNCFFIALDNEDHRSGYSFKDFAESYFIAHPTEEK